MAKRENNYSRTDERPDFKDADENIEETLDQLEKYGKLKNKTNLQQKYINPRCTEYYNEVIKINRMLEGMMNDCLLGDATNEVKGLIEILRLNKSDLQTKIINLLSIVIGSSIKRFKSLYPKHYDNVFTACVVDILDKIQKNKYNEEKSSFHSYMFETSHQACIKFIDEQAKDNDNVSLII